VLPLHAAVRVVLRIAVPLLVVLIWQLTVVGAAGRVVQSAVANECSAMGSRALAHGDIQRAIPLVGAAGLGSRSGY